MMKRRTITILIAFPLLVVIGVPIAFVAFWFAVSVVCNTGSPELAQEWRAELGNYESPHMAKTADQTVEVVTFENGQWIFGRAQNSHGIWQKGGGTLVVRDSNGEIHAYFGGHVCGSNYLSSRFRGTADLQSFYSRLSESEFVEILF